jgi:hypothetical protein
MKILAVVGALTAVIVAAEATSIDGRFVER